MTSSFKVITPREKNLGDFNVRRVLPYATQRMVGPFIFFDHMGPAEFAPGQSVSVRPHPHINLATVTYLFAGRIEHRDSLGNDRVIEPGAINWMTAGRGVVHSERTPKDSLATGSKLHGIQLWVALPEEFEETDASFTHHPKDTLPEFEVNGARIKLLLGTAFGKQSPVKVFSDLFYAEARMPKGSELTLPGGKRENAVYPIEGSVLVNGQKLEAGSMAANGELTLTALEDSCVMLLGGESLGPREIYWNFISSSRARIEEAKKDWEHGPSAGNPRFKPIPGDDLEFIPLPVD